MDKRSGSILKQQTCKENKQAKETIQFFFIAMTTDRKTERKTRNA